MHPLRIWATQAWTIARASLRTRYRRTWAGFLWVLLNPLLNFGVQYWVFRHLLQGERPDYLLYLLAGFVPWFFLSQTLETSAGGLLSHAPLIRGLRTPPGVIIVALVMESAVSFAAFLAVALAVAAGVGADVPWRALWLPLPLSILLVFVTAASSFVAMLTVFFRDTRFVVTFALSLGYLLTPIVYRPEQLGDPFLRRLVEWNPMYALIRPFRVCFGALPAADFLVSCAAALAVTAVMLGLTICLWRRSRIAIPLYL